MTDFRPVIRQAYLDILRRAADDGGLEHYNALMNATPPLTEAAVREAMLHSAEYAAANPDPPPPPPAGDMSPLRVEGNRFKTEAGSPVKLLGMVVAGDDPLTPEDEGLVLGWPMLTHEAMDLMAAHKLNYSVFRLGPNIDREVFGTGEGAEYCAYRLVGDKYDLTQWSSEFFATLADRLAYARSKGIYICISLIDSWNLDHEQTPWSAHRNLQGFEGGTLEVVRQAPKPLHVEWVRKIVRETREFENVLYLDGNESFKGHVTREWVDGIFQAAFSEMGPHRRLVSTNSGLEGTLADFIVMHDRGIPEPGSLPIVVDEYPTRSVDAVLVDAKRGWDLGTVHYIYWKGEHSIAERDRCLAGLKLIAEGGNPVPFPDTCPTLTKMGIQFFQHLNKHFQPVPGPVLEGYTIFDLTPKFGNPPRPCNDEHNERCGGRQCEDPRGGVWELLEGGSRIKVENNGFKLKVGPLVAGVHRVRCSPHPDSKDAFGKPHTVSPNAPQELSWNV